MIIIEGKEYAIDEIFQFSLLKKFFESLIVGKKENKKTYELETVIDLVKENKSKIDEIESKMLSLEINKSLAFAVESSSDENNQSIHSGLSKIQQLLLVHLDKINSRIKKIEEENFYFKTNFKDNNEEITKLTERMNSISRDNPSIKSDIRDIQKTIDKISRENEENKSSFDQRFEREINWIKEKINEKISEKTNENNMENDCEISKGKEESVKLPNNVYNYFTNKNDFNELNLKVNNLSSNIISIKSCINNLRNEFSIDETKSALADIKLALNSKASLEQQNKLKETAENNKEKIKDLINFKSEQSENSFKLTQDLERNNRNIEKINSSILLLQTMIKDKDKARDMLVLKNNKNLPLNEINASIKQVNDAITSVQKEMEDYWRELESLKPIISSACMSKDLKNLQDIFITSLEEMQVKFFKKFSDKLETQKSFKLLECQIKHLISEFEQKLYGSPDGYLLAKEAFSGLRCASCETTFRSLKNKFEYLPYNSRSCGCVECGINSPLHSNLEKPYFLGSGYSKVLSSIDFQTKENKQENKEYNSSNISNSALKIKSLKKILLSNKQSKLLKLNAENKRNNLKISEGSGGKTSKEEIINGNINVIKGYNSFNEGKNEDIVKYDVNNIPENGQPSQSSSIIINSTISHNNSIKAKSHFNNKKSDKITLNSLINSKETNQTNNNSSIDLFNNQGKTSCKTDKNTLLGNNSFNKLSVDNRVSNISEEKEEKSEKISSQKLGEIGIVKILKKSK